jgi:hypothetical protein
MVDKSGVIQGSFSGGLPRLAGLRLQTNRLNFAASGGQPLPHPVRHKMESFFKTSFADVRVHVGPQASSIGALAFTHGSNLYFAPGQYNPGTTRGQQLLGHELTHVVQQRSGRVRNPFGSGVAVVHDHGMEAEADRMGLRVAAQNQAIQRHVTVAGVLYQPGVLIRRLWEKSNDPADGLVWHDEYRDAVYALSAQNRAFGNDIDLTMSLAGHSMADRAILPANRTLRSNQFMAHAVGAVSSPSGAHRLELLNSKYADVAAHPYGWSFCATATMQGDTDTINGYLTAIRAHPDQIPPQPVAWSWNNAIDQRVEFTVNGRTYSTHEVPGHPQLYPLRGTGIKSGNGPLDMARRLRKRGELTDTRKISLYQVYAAAHPLTLGHVNQNPPAQLGTTQKQTYVDALDALI